MSMWLWWLAFWLLVVASYALSCWRWPLTRCVKCDGKGKFARPDGRVWRECRRCKGSGKRIRVGRKAFNWWHARHRQAR